jgi:putative membrane protein
VYLTIAIINMGALRSLVFTVMAYTIAFASEFSSTRNGFPYGFYSYIDTTRDQELWISNVPFMDSLSYSFLSYISLTMSLLIWSQLEGEGWNIRLKESARVLASWRVVFTGALFFMLMDVIIDPVAFLGDRWFLGKIYTYQEKGEYFNIPLTNFAGWFLVGSAILFSFTRIDRWLGEKFPVRKRQVFAQALLGPGLYFGVLIFNLAVTFYIGEILLGLCGVLLTTGLLLLVLYKIKKPEKFHL